MNFENRHRSRKRQKEMDIAMEILAHYIEPSEHYRVFEFGSGEGHQLPYLKIFGDVVASDVYQNDDVIHRYPDVKWITCDVRDIPLESKSFNLIFSNHVIEHVDDIDKAFSELKRVGKDDCIYAFTVPTNLWLILSLPAQVYNGVRKIFPTGGGRDVQKDRDCIEEKSKEKCSKFLPRGHGWRKNFFDCYKSFKRESWRRLFLDNGFHIVEEMPLLLYAPSEFPIIPTVHFPVKKGLCSSIMFVFKKS